MSRNEKRDCYSCKHRGTIPGDAHSCCNAVDTLLGILIALTGRGGPRMTPHGIRNGWANWPINFDPIWIEHCPYYESKNENTTSI